MELTEITGVPHKKRDIQQGLKIVGNGSVIGYSPYAHNLGLPFEKPKQTMLILDMKKLEIVKDYTIILD